MNLKEARNWCAAAHGNQGYGNTSVDDGGMDGFHPYKFHLRKTEEVALRFGFRDSSIRKACWGHDVIEDRGKTCADLLYAGFAPYEVALIWAVTDGKGKTRRERKHTAYRKIRRTPGAIIVKLCDRIANVEHAVQAGSERKYELYKREMVEFEQYLRDRDDLTVAPMWEHLEWLFTEDAKTKLWATVKCCRDHHAYHPAA
jgi:(p)ppGpp synthase/HD superfamily hydrolase